ncbi:hypothetical protein R1sor_020042 [Riccia sorocarpa]|uniref:HTH CENPB-type domain-containing protein n=1 Tax=Riccia sorocarpa TaxID=122646 RepID=A0ABD3II15_9MARC
MRRMELNVAERIEICRHHESTNITNKALSRWATEKWRKTVSEMTISRVLKRKSEFLQSQGSKLVHRYRKPECPDLEKILFIWFLAMQEGNVTISDEMLVAKARMLQNSVPRETVKEIKFSNGWLQGFKKRHGISAYVRHGEAASAEITAEVLDRVEGLKALISGYEPEDVFNMDETALFFQLEPNRTLQGHQEGKRNRRTVCQSHSRIEFLPLNVTAVFRPLDAGIIRAFKAHYRKRLIKLKLERLQSGQTSEVDVYDAVLMIQKSWSQDVTSKTVRKCWVHSKLVSITDILTDFNTSGELPDLNTLDGTRELT